MEKEKSKRWTLDTEEMRNLIYNQQQRQSRMLEDYKLPKREEKKNKL